MRRDFASHAHKLIMPVLPLALKTTATDWYTALLLNSLILSTG